MWRFFTASTYPDTANLFRLQWWMANLVHLWKMFKLAELTEDMHPKGDDTFIDLLNNVRTASINDHDENLLKSPGLYRIMILIIQLLHIFSENRQADQHNSAMLNEIS